MRSCSTSCSGLNGFEICAALREDENWTPILMLTAKDGEYDQAEALNTGADDYLTKPFSYIVLLAHLRALIEARRPRTARGARGGRPPVRSGLEAGVAG